MFVLADLEKVRLVRLVYTISYSSASFLCLGASSDEIIAFVFIDLVDLVDLVFLVDLACSWWGVAPQTPHWAAAQTRLWGLAPQTPQQLIRHRGNKNFPNLCFQTAFTRSQRACTLIISLQAHTNATSPQTLKSS